MPDSPTDSPTDRPQDASGLIQPRDDGQLHFAKGTEGWTFPVAAPASATPLADDEPEGVIPPNPLYALKQRAHGGLHLFGHPTRIRAVAGTGDAAVYAIDDGPHHCMIGRPVGTTGDGCAYALVGRVTRETWDALAAGQIDGRQAFSVAAEVGVSGTVADGGLSEVFDVLSFAEPTGVPEAYLPPSPPIAFTEPLPTTGR